MMSLPESPHLIESEADPFEERVMDTFETRSFLSNRIIVQEKIDGYNLTVHFTRGRAVIRHRGQQVTYPVYRDGFRDWIADRESIMNDAIGDRLVIHGEWMKKRSRYTNPPDLFLIHDIFDKESDEFWCCPKVQQFCNILGMATVPHIWEGIASLDDIYRFSRAITKYGKEPIGSVYLRYEDDRKVLERAQFRHVSGLRL